MKSKTKYIAMAALLALPLIGSCGKKESSSSSSSSSSSAPLPTYEVKFVNYDNALLQTVSVEEGKAAVYTEATPTRPADDQYTYTFKGWDKADDLKVVKSSFTTKALYDSAVNEYQVTFTSRDVKVFDEKEPYGTAFSTIKPADPAEYFSEDERTHYTFKGWDINNDGAVDALPTTVTGTFAAVAIFDSVQRFKVTFFDDDHTTVLKAATFIDKGATAIAPENPTKASTEQYSYAFKEWNPSTLTNIQADTDFVAVYTATIQSYTITFTGYYADNSTSEADTRTVVRTQEYGTMVGNEIPTVVDYTDGKTVKQEFQYLWKIGDSLYTAANLASMKLTGNVTATADYKRTAIYSVTFHNYNDTASVLEYYDDGEYIGGSWTWATEVKALATRSNTAQYTYSLKGVSLTKDTADDGSAEVLDTSYAITANTDVYMVWARSVNSYSITYTVDGSTTKTSASIAYGTKVDPNAVAPSGAFNKSTATTGTTGTHDRLDGWTIGGVTYAIGETFTITGNVTAIASYSSNVTYYEEYLNGNGGYVRPASQASGGSQKKSVYFDADKTCADNLKKYVASYSDTTNGNYAFANWKSVENNTTALTYKPTAADQNFCACWNITNITNLGVNFLNESANGLYYKTGDDQLWGVGDYDTDNDFLFIDGSTRQYTRLVSQGLGAYYNNNSSLTYSMGSKGGIADYFVKGGTANHNVFTLGTNSKLYVQGMNNHGCLGLGTATMASSPTAATGSIASVTIKYIATEAGGTLVADTNNDLWYAGYRNGTDLTTFTKIYTHGNWDSVVGLYADQHASETSPKFLILKNNSNLNNNLVYAFGAAGTHKYTNESAWIDTPTYMDPLTDSERTTYGDIQDLRINDEFVMAITSKAGIVYWGHDRVGGSDLYPVNHKVVSLSGVSMSDYRGMSATIDAGAFLFNGKLGVFGNNTNYRLGATGTYTTTAGVVSVASTATDISFLTDTGTALAFLDQDGIYAYGSYANTLYGAKYTKIVGSANYRYLETY